MNDNARQEKENDHDGFAWGKDSGHVLQVR